MNATYQSNRNNSGFTIVELLIVIVVIGILAAISVVAYNGVVTRASNMSRLSEMRQWEKLFVLYKTLNGVYPVISTGYGNYCLGTGFPTQSETNQLADSSNQASTNNPDGYCRDIRWASSRHEVSSELNNALRTMGSLPGVENHKIISTSNARTGPYYSYGNKYITGVFIGDTCPQDTTQAHVYSGGAATLCTIDLP